MYKRKVTATLPATSPAPGVLVTPPAPGSLAAAAPVAGTPRKRRQRKPKMLTMVENFIAAVRTTEPHHIIEHQYSDKSAWREPAWLVYQAANGAYVYMCNSGHLLYRQAALPEASFMRIGPSQWVELTNDMAKAS